MPFLYRVQSNNCVVSHHPVGRKALIVGRCDSADLSVPEDPWLSRRHFVLIPRPDGFFLRDLHSANGTWVNGERVFHYRLRPLDQIRAGHSLFTLEPGLATAMQIWQPPGWRTDSPDAVDCFENAPANFAS